MYHVYIKEFFIFGIKQAQAALKDDNSSYFSSKLPAKETWRLYNYFKDQTGYLDIEINSTGKVILVGIHDGNNNTNFFIRGANLELPLLEKELQKYKLLITFNGAAFDLPKLKKQLNLQLTIPHIDLKPVCLKLNLNGGLKEIEHILNLKRPSHLYGSPIELWKAFHASGDREYLQLLLDYNREDCENLQRIMDYCYKKLKENLTAHFK